VKGETMLFLAENDFFDVVREEQFKDVVTVSASSPLALAKFRPHSEGMIIVNKDDMVFPFMVHVTAGSAAYLLQTTRVFGAETVQQISPPAVAFCFRGTHSETQDPTGGYCWPDEVDDVYFALTDLEDISFYPLFEVPSDLEHELQK
jgi:hypothetical protein